MKLNPTDQRSIARALRYYLDNSIPASDAEEKILRQVAGEYERRAKNAACAAIDVEHVAGRVWRVGPARIRLSACEHLAMCVAIAAIHKPNEIVDPALFVTVQLAPAGVTVSSLQMSLSRLRRRLATQLPILSCVSLRDEGLIVCNPRAK